MKKIGYARVSTDAQKVDMQYDALKEAGCTDIYTDKISGSKFIRPGLEEMMKYAQSQLSTQDICDKLKISRRTLYKYLKIRNAK